MNNNKNKNVLISCVFLLVIFLFMAINLLRTDNTESSIEMRTLSQKPRITLAGVMDGQYFKDLDSYTQDQLAFKNKIVKTYKKVSLDILNRVKVGDFFVVDAYLIRDYTYPMDEKIKKAEDSVNYYKKLNTKLNKMDKNLYVVHAPSSSEYRVGKLPTYIEKDTESKILNFENTLEKTKEFTNFINMRTVFNENDKLRSNEFYYKTDHHWNSHGAFLGYTELINMIKKDYPIIESPMTINDMNIDRHDVFNGSYNRALQLTFKHDDKFELYEPKNPVKYEKFTDGIRNNIVNYKDYINTSNTYATFMGGDRGNDVIKTNRSELPNILIVGNSFTNPTEYWISQHFNETHSLDLRHYKKMNTMEYIEKHDIDVVVMMYGGIIGI